MKHPLLLLALTPLLLGAGRVQVAPGVDLHYVEAGQGPPIVFIPGWTLTTELFQAQLEAFLRSPSCGELRSAKPRQEHEDL